MALTVETGSGVAGADAYVTLAAAAAYWAARPHMTASASWAASTDANREGAIREATAWIDREFGQRFVGRRVSASQALAWPRETGETDTAGDEVPLEDADGHEIEGLPVCVVTAACEVAAQALAGALVSAARTDGVKVSRVGDVSTEFFDGGGAASSARKAIGNILAPVMDGEGGAVSWRWR